MAEKGVIFRRINGKVVPIKVNRSRSKKPRKSYSERAKESLGQGALVGSGFYGAARGADKWADRRMRSINAKLKNMPKKPPKFSMTKPTRPQWGDEFLNKNTPLGDMARREHAKQLRVYREAKSKFQAENRTYKQAKGTIRNLRTRRFQLHKIKGILNRKALPIAIAAGAAGAAEHFLRNDD